MKKAESRVQRHNKIRKLITGTAERPRLSVFRSNRFMSAQIIDDVAGKTLVSASNLKTKAKPEAVAVELAKAAQAKKIKSVVFDRAGFLYAGRVKAFADAARKAGLEF